MKAFLVYKKGSGSLEINESLQFPVFIICLGLAMLWVQGSNVVQGKETFLFSFIKSRQYPTQGDLYSGQNKVKDKQ